jgi:hypothetical protein
VIPENQSRQDFDDLLQGFLSCLQPRNPSERACVDRMAAAKWRLRNLHATETRLFNEAIAAQPANLPHDAQTRIAEAFLSLVSVPGFVVLSRYESTQDLNFHRALRNLLDLRSQGVPQTGREEQPPDPQQDTPEQAPPSGKPGLKNKICTNKATLSFPYAAGCVTTDETAPNRSLRQPPPDSRDQDSPQQVPARSERRQPHRVDPPEH